MAIDHESLRDFMGVLLIRQSYVTGEEFLVAGSGYRAIFDKPGAGPWRYSLRLYMGGRQRTGVYMTYSGGISMYIQVFKR